MVAACIRVSVMPSRLGCFDTVMPQPPYLQGPQAPASREHGAAHAGGLAARAGESEVRDTVVAIATFKAKLHAWATFASPNPPWCLRCNGLRLIPQGGGGALWRCGGTGLREPTEN
jgi:hypothetical protein